MSTIQYPGKHDVMLGRGGESNYHSGNIAFRHMVQKYKERFRLGSRTEKNKVIDEVVNEWRDQDPAGRFVAKKKTDSGVVWYDVGNELAKKRASKSLAEWAPPTSQNSSSAGKQSPSEGRKKRSRAAANNDCDSPTGFLLQQPAGNKRQNRALLSSPVNSFTVLNMASAHQQQLPEQLIQQLPEQLIQPLPVYPQSTPQDIFSSSMTATLQDSFSSSSSGGVNQHCNINRMDVLPLERIRLQLPTAAELAGCAFSDDDKSLPSDSSRGSNGLLPNKPNIMMDYFKDTSSTGIIPRSNMMMDSFKDTTSLSSHKPSMMMDSFQDTSSTSMPRINSVGLFGGQHLFMI